MGQLRRFLCCSSGATSIEYAMIGGAIAIGIVGGLSTVGTKLKSFFDQLVTGIH